MGCNRSSGGTELLPSVRQRRSADLCGLDVLGVLSDLIGVLRRKTIELAVEELHELRPGFGHQRAARHLVVREELGEHLRPAERTGERVRRGHARERLDELESLGRHLRVAREEPAPDDDLRRHALAGTFQLLLDLDERLAVEERQVAGDRVEDVVRRDAAGEGLPNHPADDLRDVGRVRRWPFAVQDLGTRAVPAGGDRLRASRRPPKRTT